MEPINNPTVAPYSLPYMLQRDVKEFIHPLSDLLLRDALWREVL